MCTHSSALLFPLFSWIGWPCRWVLQCSVGSILSPGWGAHLHAALWVCKAAPCCTHWISVWVEGPLVCTKSCGGFRVSAGSGSRMGGWGCATAPLHVSQKTWMGLLPAVLVQGKCEQWRSLNVVVWGLPLAPSGSHNSPDFSVQSLLLVMQKLKLAHCCPRRICFQYRCTFHVFLGEGELSIQHAVILDLPPCCSHFLTSVNILIQSFV